MANGNKIGSDVLSVDWYRSAVAVCNGLAILASQGPLAVHLQRISLLKQIQKLWTKGKNFEITLSGNRETDSGDELVNASELKSETDILRLPSTEINEDNCSILANNCTLQSIKEELQENMVNNEKNVHGGLLPSAASNQQCASPVKSLRIRYERRTKKSLTVVAVVSTESTSPTTDGTVSGEDSAELNFVCTDCDLNFKTYAQLKSHKTREHESAVTTTKTVHNTDAIDCKVDAPSKKKTSLKAKYKSVYDQREHVCHACGKKFLMKCELRNHLKIHTGEKPFMCSVCGKCFRIKSMLNEHTRIHLDDRRHSCFECGKSFVQSSGLKDHFVAVHSKVRAHVCSVCGQEFFRITLLNYHMRSHTGEKPYCCSVCGKKFALSRQLRSHVVIHGDDCPFQCEICSKKFKSKGGLNRHKRLHLEVKPFRCTFCPRTFTQGSNLRVHLRTHTGEKPYKCTDCGQKFSHQPTLKKHRESTHKSR